MTHLHHMHPHTTRRLALGTTMLTSLFLIVSPPQMSAQQVEDEECIEALVPQPDDCRRANGNIAVTMPTGENVELIRSRPGGNFNEQGFSISIDYETIAGAPAPVDPRRGADLRNAARDIDLRYDGLDTRRLLNVTTTDLRAAYRGGDSVQFRASSNYPAYIARAEVRIIDVSGRGQPVVQILDVAPNGTVEWQMPQDGSGDLAYVLRVYDARGRYDETQPLTLTRTDEVFETHETFGGGIIAAGEGEDRTRIRNIATGGGRITTSGQVTPGAQVVVLGEAVPVDASGKFVVSRILPAGVYAVSVAITENGRTETVIQDIEIPDHEFFGVGLVDLTFGVRLRDDLASGNPEYEDTYSEGRLAGYVTGTTASGYRYTAQVDTGNGPLKDVFRRLDEKDPRRVIQRMDPDDVYPTYGDDSTAFDDAPTSGRAYLRVERDGTRFIWGDFKAGTTGTDLLSSTRTLYGAQVTHDSLSVTSDGNARVSVSGFVASPDTLPQRDIQRGTGGSVYFLTRQDINGGSETIAVQVTDPVTGRVVSSRVLTAGVDYEIDYIQGVILLAQPLSSSTGGFGVVTTGTAGDFDVNLVSQYEYTPTAGSLDGASVGGRAEVWVSDQLRLGVTGMRDSTGTADQTMQGVDLRYQIGEQSYVQAELAQTDGPGFGRSLSSNGGLTISTDGSVTTGRARAYSFDSLIDLEELGLSTPGQIGVYFDRKQNGFSTLAENITENQTLWGVNGVVDLSDNLAIGFDVEDFQKAGGDGRTEAEAFVSYQLDDMWSIDGGLAYIDQAEAGAPERTGSRTDFALRLNARQSEDALYYVFGQATLDRSGGLENNNRIGAGFEGQLSEKISTNIEVSGGTGGFGARAKLAYAPTDDNEFYLGYTLDPTRTGFSTSSLLGAAAEEEITVGTRYTVSETTEIYGENNWDLFGTRRSLTRAYGVNYQPTARWTLSGTIENGEVRDDTTGDFERDAVSLGVSFVDDDRSEGRLRVEYRTEDGANIDQDRDTWAVSGGYSYKLDEDWRVLLNLDSLISDSDQSSFRDGEYVEASLGYAYRPVGNERLNMLMRYTYLMDLPGEDQVTVNGSVDGPEQRSHVLSIDAIYDLSPRLSIGGKYGYRTSEVAARGTDAFTDNTAQLGIVRLDWHVVHKWDVLLEGRILASKGSSSRETGGLLAVYRHVGNNAKIGLGYEMGRVSDDLTDLDYDSRGLFLNVIAKF